MAYLGVLAALLAGAYVLSQSEVLAVGEFVDSVDHDVARLRVLDRYTIYTDETFVPFTSDTATSFVLMAASGMAMLAFAMAVALRTPDRKVPLFFLLVAFGATVFAFDEQMELIDSLGYNIEALYVPDLFLYGPPVALFAFWFRDILLASSRVLAVFVVGGGFFALAEVFDRLPHDRFEGIEEKLEVLAALVLAFAIALMAVRLLTRADAQPGHDVAGLCGSEQQSGADEGDAVDGGAGQRG